MTQRAPLRSASRPANDAASAPAAPGAKAARHAGSQAVMRCSQQKRQVRPERGKGRKDQESDGRCLAQRRLLHDEFPQRADCLCVTHRLHRRKIREPPPQQRHKRCGHCGRGQKDGTPSQHRSHPAAGGPSQQDSQQKSGHHGSNGASALVRLGQLRCDRDQHVRDRGGDSNRHAGRNQGPQRRREACRQQRHGDRREELHDQSAALRHVAHRHKHQNPRRITHLRRHRHRPNLGGGGMEGAAHLQQQRLVVVNRRHARTARHPKEWK